MEVKWKFGFLFKARNQSEAFIFRPSNLFPLETILKNGFMKNMLDFILHNAIIKKKKKYKNWYPTAAGHRINGIELVNCEIS